MTARAASFHIAAFLLAGGAIAPGVAAQTTSTVYNPVISEGYRAVQLGVATTDAGDNREDRTGARFIYDQALDARRMARLQIVGNDRGKEGFEFAYVQPSFYQELTPEDAEFWKSTLRLDLRLAEGQAPEQVAAHWANQFDLTDKWRVRAHLVGSDQFGDLAADGLFLNSRASLSRSLGEGRYFALDWFGAYNTTETIGSFQDQVHQAGPTFTARFNETLTWNAGVLLGLNDRSPDADFRFWIVRTLGD